MSAKKPPSPRSPSPRKLESTFLLLGKVGRAHGLAGDFFVSGREEPIPMRYGDVWIGPAEETAVKAKLVQSRWQGDRTVLRCSLSTSREQAEALTGQLIFAPQEKARPASGDGWVWGSLEGVMIIASDGETLGAVQHIYNAGASDIAVVEDAKGRRIDLPLIDDYFDIGKPIVDRRITMTVPFSTFADLWEGGH